MDIKSLIISLGSKFGNLEETEMDADGLNDFIMLDVEDITNKN